MIVCHVCGTENPDGAKFCEGCGVELGAAATPAVTTAAETAGNAASAMPPVAPTPGFSSDAPVETPPLESAPVDSAPIQSAPIESAPVQSTPAQSAPIEQPPLEVEDAPVLEAAPVVVVSPVVTPPTPAAIEPDIKATMAGLEQQPVTPNTAKPKVARLVPRAMGSSGEGYVLSSDHMVVGRFDPSAGPVDIDLGGQPGEGYISRRHAELYAENGTWMVRDLGSTNGVYVKKAGQGQYSPRIVEPTALGDGDEVAFGNVKFLFLNSSEA